MALVQTQKNIDFLGFVLKINVLNFVGMTRFELATTRPPDECDHDVICWFCAVWRIANC